MVIGMTFPVTDRNSCTTCFGCLLDSNLLLCFSCWSPLPLFPLQICFVFCSLRTAQVPDVLVLVWRQSIVKSAYFCVSCLETFAENATECLTSVISLNRCRIFALPSAHCVSLSLLERMEHVLLGEEHGLWNALLVLSSSCHLCQHSFAGLLLARLSCS